MDGHLPLTCSLFAAGGLLGGCVFADSGDNVSCLKCDQKLPAEDLEDHLISEHGVDEETDQITAVCIARGFYVLSECAIFTWRCLHVTELATFVFVRKRCKLKM